MFRSKVFEPTLTGISYSIFIEDLKSRTIERQTELQNDHDKIRKNARLTTGFRKSFDTQLIYADVRPAIKEMFTRYSIGLDDYYFKPSQKVVLDEYMTAVDYWL